MKKTTIIFIIFLCSGLASFAFGDFFEFGSPYNKYSLKNNNLSFKNFRKNNWSNPYEETNANLSELISTKRLNKHANSIFNNLDSDFEYILSKMEQKKFGHTYSDENIETRLDRLEENIFGASQDGNIINRVNLLKRACSAENIKTKPNKFREIFSSGYPTSIPVNGDYYSTLENSFSSW